MMTIRSLFNIILKVIGILYLKEVVIALPAIIDLFLRMFDDDNSSLLWSLFISIVTLGSLTLIVYLLIFKTDTVMNKLRLTTNLPEGEIHLNVHRSTVLTIAIIITGLLLITQAAPFAIKEIVRWFQYRQTLKSLFGGLEPFQFGNLFVYISEVVIGLLLIGNQRKMVSFIERSQKK